MKLLLAAFLLLATACAHGQPAPSEDLNSQYFYSTDYRNYGFLELGAGKSIAVYQVPSLVSASPQQMQIGLAASLGVGHKFLPWLGITGRFEEFWAKSNAVEPGQVNRINIHYLGAEAEFVKFFKKQSASFLFLNLGTGIVIMDARYGTGTHDQSFSMAGTIEPTLGDIPLPTFIRGSSGVSLHIANRISLRSSINFMLGSARKGRAPQKFRQDIGRVGIATGISVAF